MRHFQRSIGESSSRLLARRRPNAADHVESTGFTLIELLVVIAIISTIAGFIVPSLIGARRNAVRLECTNNLRQLYTFALAYSDESDQRAFPIGAGRKPPAHESLGVLVEFQSEPIDPELFVCPGSSATPAIADENGEYVLGAENVGYAWTDRRTKSTAANRIIACCKYVDGYEDDDGVHDGHQDGVNALFSDGSVRFIKVSELQEDTLLPAGVTR